MVKISLQNLEKYWEMCSSRRTTHRIILLSFYSINYMLSLKSWNYFIIFARISILSYDVQISYLYFSYLLTLEITSFSNVLYSSQKTNTLLLAQVHISLFAIRPVCYFESKQNFNEECLFLLKCEIRKISIVRSIRGHTVYISLW